MLLCLFSDENTHEERVTVCLYSCTIVTVYRSPVGGVAPQTAEGEAKSAAGNGNGGGSGSGQATGRTRRRLSAEDEDLEGGLDEDWGHDVDVIELQNRLPDTSTVTSRDKGGKSKGKSKGKAKGGKAAAAAAAAAAAEVVAEAEAAAQAEVAAAAGKPDAKHQTATAAEVAV